MISASLAPLRESERDAARRELVRRGVSPKNAVKAERLLYNAVVAAERGDEERGMRMFHRAVAFYELALGGGR